MECQDYLSFSQKPTKTLRPPPLFVTTLLSEIIPEPANISDVLPPHTTFYQIISIFVKLFQKRRDKIIKSQKNITMKTYYQVSS